METIMREIYVNCNLSGDVGDGTEDNPFGQDVDISEHLTHHDIAVTGYRVNVKNVEESNIANEKLFQMTEYLSSEFSFVCFQRRPH